ncbi:hypothetical protein [Spirulina sp. 06S082]|uniref:hypothetical protein n=1 Tax=Spirulina sp. 06S082 TaxID=3110248 RepID=UPI002B21030D|nr:hypothetical protein [Spirulina sp. 06S082]MEA5467709.1 hypothetical protein [Spirulina sp. 06S082]
MSKKFTREQLDQLLREIQQLSDRAEDELDREEVEAVLRELNLPPELLDEAMRQVSRHKALKDRKIRYRCIGFSIMGVFLIAIAVFFISFYSRQQALDRVAVYQDRITLISDNKGNLERVRRQDNPEVFYRVTLEQSPLGQPLALQCNWYDPSGRIAHQNRYRTRAIATEVWNTYCRYQFSSLSSLGTWKVQMMLGDRILSDRTLKVE